MKAPLEKGGEGGQHSIYTYITRTSNLRLKNHADLEAYSCSIVSNYYGRHRCEQEGCVICGRQHGPSLLMYVSEWHGTNLSISRDRLRKQSRSQ